MNKIDKIYYELYENEILDSYAIYDLTPIQWQYWSDKKHNDIIVAAGRRARKTMIGKRKFFIAGLENGNHNYLFAGPVYAQAKNIFWKDLKKACQFFGIAESISDSELIIELYNGTIFQVVGLDRAFRFEGVQRNGIYVTEAPNVKYEYWDENIFPMLADTDGILIRDGTPDFRNPKYEGLARYNCGGFVPKPRPSYGAHAENPNDPDCCFYSWLSSDVLQKKVLQKFRRRMDPLTYQQEFEAAFITSKGRVYYPFTSDNVIRQDFDPRKPVIMTWDVNYSDAPMATVIIQEFWPREIWGDFIPDFVDKSQSIFIATKEFVNQNTNTGPQCEIIKGFLDENHFTGPLMTYGDSVGNHRRVGAPLVHYKIVEKYLGHYPSYKKKTRPTLSIPDRITSLNSLICNMDGKRRFFISHYIDAEGFPAGCPELLEDLQQNTYAKNGYDLDKSDILRTHAGDAATYWSYNDYEVNFKEIYSTVI